MPADDEFRNYTGDILNFGLAKERFAAQHPDKADTVKFLVVGDDVAVGRAQGSIVGRRYATTHLIPLRSLDVFKQTAALLARFLSTKLPVPWRGEAHPSTKSMP